MIDSGLQAILIKVAALGADTFLAMPIPMPYVENTHCGSLCRFEGGASWQNIRANVRALAYNGSIHFHGVRFLRVILISSSFSTTATALMSAVRAASLRP